MDSARAMKKVESRRHNAAVIVVLKVGLVALSRMDSARAMKTVESRRRKAVTVNYGPVVLAIERNPQPLLERPHKALLPV
jgi:hypothetical protein